MSAEEIARNPMPTNLPADALARIPHLVALLRREGNHSGVWFADQLLEAAATIETLQAQLAEAVEERGKVVAWLRRLAGEFVTPSILAFFGDPFKRDGQLLCINLADAIARGEHLGDGE